jgi:hypothetical protein
MTVRVAVEGGGGAVIVTLQVRVILSTLELASTSFMITVAVFTPAVAYAFETDCAVPERPSLPLHTHS